MGAHLTTFPASYGWMHDQQKYVVEQDHATLPVQLRPFDDSGNGDFKNSILFSSESRGFSESQVRDLWPIINAVSADTADRVYDLPVMKAFPAISDWYQEQFARPCTQDLDDSHKATSFDYIRQVPGKYFCEILGDASSAYACLVLTRPRQPSVWCVSWKGTAPSSFSVSKRLSELHTRL